MIARIVVAGTSSGAGKTTVACGLIGALRARGLRVQGFKVGPDYIDPSYHALASGRPGRNLDAFLSGPELIAPLVRHGSRGADVAVVEGVMGLFDGASGRGELASTAHVAKLLDAPVVLVVDGSAMARSAAAIVHGFATFDPELRIAGVIFNRVGSEHHEDLLREAVAPLGIPVLGALRRDGRVVAPERHLGLVPAGEREQRTRAALDTLAGAVARHVDVPAIERLARAAAGRDAGGGAAWSPDPCAAALRSAAGHGPSAVARPVAGPAAAEASAVAPPAASAAEPTAVAPPAASAAEPSAVAPPVAGSAAAEPCAVAVPAAGPAAAERSDRQVPAAEQVPAAGARIAIARGPAFSFHYEENLELLAAAGAELAAFDPLCDERLPADCGALILAGGFPEVFGAELSANASLRAEVAAFVVAGRPVLAECGGLLYLCDELDGHEMCGAIGGWATMTSRLSLGYREATAITATPWLRAGERVRGHEFHYSQLQPTRTAGSAAPAASAGSAAPAASAGSAAWSLSARGMTRPDGVVAGALQASYLHVHWAAHPHLALRFAHAARAAHPAAA
jgi:cobyrinic acid a,c-diamide synthase